MSEIADDMIEGSSCCLCGCYYEDPDDEDALYEHGYPAVCWSCWRYLSKQERKEYQRAKVNTI